MEWIAHRGINRDHTENSKRAFDRAIELGCHTLETDLRMCRSGDIVLCHDRDFARLGGPSQPVANLSRRELESVRLGKSHEPAFFLDDFLSLYPGHDWIFDIKPETSGAVVKQLVDRFAKGAKHLWFANHVSFVLWDRASRLEIQQAFPESRCFKGSLACYRAGIAHLLGCSALAGVESEQWYTLTPELWGINLFRKDLVRRYQQKGAKVLAFLPEHEKQMTLALQAGFDAILCDWRGPEPTEEER